VRRLVVLLALAAIILISGVVILVWNPFAHGTSTNPQKNEILFVGAGFNEASSARNSTVVGNFKVNMTEAGMLQFTLGAQEYYPPGTIGNHSTYSTVHTFTAGSISTNSSTSNFEPIKQCMVNSSSTTESGSTVYASATCNASDVPVTIVAVPIRTYPAGVSQFEYSLIVPDNATLGTYLIDIYMQSESSQNLANVSNNLVYVLTLNVTS
jgi:hypothetical protein